jgi:hypothetical protein
MEGVKPLTVAEIGIAVHNRYAKDQEVSRETRGLALDAAPHFQISVVHPVYPSRCDELVGFNQRGTPWACFEPPPDYTPAKPRGYFGASILPSLSPQKHLCEEDLNTEAFKEEKEQILAAETDHGIAAETEAQRTCLLDLFRSLEELEELLRNAQSERLRTQKS